MVYERSINPDSENQDPSFRSATDKLCDFGQVIFLWDLVLLFVHKEARLDDLSMKHTFWKVLYKLLSTLQMFAFVIISINIVII